MDRNLDNVDPTVDDSRGEDSETLEIPSCSVTDCQLPTDVVLESCDGFRYGAHSTNLEAYSAGFPPAASTQFNGEVVQLPENSKVLGLLLHYMHNERQPDSSEIPFKVLAPLAEAVEKYMVFSAMEVCKIRMQFVPANIILGYDFTPLYAREALPSHPLDVLCYAVKHGYPKLSQMAIPKTLSISLNDVSKALTDRPDIILKWVQYREHWLHLLKFIYEKLPTILHRGGVSDCGLWAPFYQRVVLEVGANIGKVQQFDDIVKTHTEQYLDECTHCQKKAYQWRTTFANRLSQIPSFEGDIN